MISRPSEILVEKVSSFGQSELNGETLVIPVTVQQYFMRVERIDPLYVQARTPDDVEAVTRGVNNILQSRHRLGATYKVENLTEILTVVLVLVSAIALI